MQASASISCASSLAHLTSVTVAVGLESNQPTLAAGRCGSMCLQVNCAQKRREFLSVETLLRLVLFLSIFRHRCTHVFWHRCTHALVSGHANLSCRFALVAEPSAAAAAARCLLECTSWSHYCTCIICWACCRTCNVTRWLQHSDVAQFFRLHFTSQGSSIVPLRTGCCYALHLVQ